jgi:hypothetical protein
LAARQHACAETEWQHKVNRAKNEGVAALRLAVGAYRGERVAAAAERNQALAAAAEAEERTQLVERSLEP